MSGLEMILVGLVMAKRNESPEGPGLAASPTLMAKCQKNMSVVRPEILMESGVKRDVNSKPCCSTQHP